MIISLLTIPAAWRRRSILATTRLLPVMGVLLLCRGLYILVSSDRQFALRSCLELLIYLVALILAVSLYQQEGLRAFLPAARVVGVLGLVAASSVVAFRISPAMEQDYLRGAPADVLLGRNTTNAILSGAYRNNVLDPGKSGGLFFVNGNTAAMLLIVIVCLLFVLKRNGFGTAAALFMLLATFFTGSKFGSTAALLIVLAALVLKARDRGFRVFAPIIALVATVAGALSIPYLMRTQFAADSTFTFGTRQVIWRFAFQHLSHNPLFGDGYGGWQLAVMQSGWEHGVPLNAPPHNMLLYAWSQTGAAGLILTTFIVAALVVHCFRTLSSGARGMIGMGAVATLLIVIQGMGENTSFSGELRSQVIAAVAAALVINDRIPAGDLARDDAMSKSIVAHGG
jgi:O-antigen ligase